MDFEFENLSSEVLYHKRSELRQKLQSLIVEGEDKLVLKHVLLDVQNMKEKMEDFLLIIKQNNQVESSEQTLKDMLLKIGREQVVLMSRVYALGSGWLLNTIQDIQSFLGSPATTKIEVKECDQDMKVDIEDIEVVPELGHQSNQHQLKQELDNSTQDGELEKISDMSDLHCNLCEYVATQRGHLKQHKLHRHEARTFQCELCDHAAPTKRTLKQHKEIKHEGLTYPCDQCNLSPSTMSSLLRHKRRKHVLHRCLDCGYKCRSLPNLWKHARLEHGLDLRQDNGLLSAYRNTDLPGEAENTNGSSTDEERLNDDMERDEVRDLFKKHNTIGIEDKNEKGGKEGLSCDECNFWTLNPRALKGHVAINHDGIRYSCDNCDYKATTTFHLKKHKQSKHKGMRYSCDDCEYSATSKYLLKKHSERDHTFSSNRSKAKDLYQPSVEDVKVGENQETNTYLCDQCDFTTTHLRYLKSHTENMHEGIRYPCDQCSYEASRKFYLKAHKRSKHEGINYQCDQCEFQTGTVYSLKGHKERKHSDNKYFCDRCEYVSTNMEDLKRHIKNKHEGVKYPCDKCDFVGSQASSLSVHQKSVHKAIRFSCDKCEYVSIYSSTLKKHIEIKHLGIRHPCDQCESTFTEMKNLHQHLKRKHNLYQVNSN